MRKYLPGICKMDATVASTSWFFIMLLNQPVEGNCAAEIGAVLLRIFDVFTAISALNVLSPSGPGNRSIKVEYPIFYKVISSPISRWMLHFSTRLAGEIHTEAVQNRPFPQEGLLNARSQRLMQIEEEDSHLTMKVTSRGRLPMRASSIPY